MLLIPVIVVTALWFGDSTFAKKGETNATDSLTGETNAADSLTVELVICNLCGTVGEPKCQSVVGIEIRCRAFAG